MVRWPHSTTYSGKHGSDYRCHSNPASILLRAVRRVRSRSLTASGIVIFSCILGLLVVQLSWWRISEVQWVLSTHYALYFALSLLANIAGSVGVFKLTDGNGCAAQVLSTSVFEQLSRVVLVSLLVTVVLKIQDPPRSLTIGFWSFLPLRMGMSRCIRS